MKKLITFLRSMKFGVGLMLMVIAFSLIGSFLPQGRTVDWYNTYYASSARLILALGFNDVFSSWYFVLLLGLLCANLTLCSVIRFGSVLHAKKNALSMAEKTQEGGAVCDEDRDKLCEYLSKKHYHVHKSKDEDTRIFYKNTLGYYASFVVHIGILLILVFGALTLHLSETSDHFIIMGESLALADGTVLTVDAFRMTDETGRLDYTSRIRVVAPGGKQAVSREISVNYPLAFQSYKYYQHSFGTAGSITAINAETGGKDDFSVTEPCFLSIDGRNGIWYEALYQGYVKDEEGHIIPVASGSGVYADPVYKVMVISEGQMTSAMALSGETIQLGNISFTFNEPVNYPGIRVKHTPAIFLALLYFAFILITFGFWLCFFHMPSLVVIRRNNYALLGTKNIGIQLEIDALLSKTGERSNA